MAYDKTLDSELTCLDASHLFDSSVTRIGFRKGTYLRTYMFDFMKIFAPHLQKELVDEALSTGSQAELDELFEGIDLPSY
jgi:LysR family cys regulon transcriptional activator